MKIFKYFIGILFAFYALAQLIKLILMFAFGNVDFSKPYTGGLIFGSVAGICIGTGVAVIFFRPKKP